MRLNFFKYIYICIINFFFCYRDNYSNFFCFNFWKNPLCFICSNTVRFTNPISSWSIYHNSKLFCIRLHTLNIR